MSQVFIEMCGEADRASELRLAAAQPMDTCLVDSTCLRRPTSISRSTGCSFAT
ncbi:MAG: hypothetical protein J6386_12105 [Candidatus Synoicihabitans palmerolidicus]|nr:hypothetical protein [Candidatus Synoicihabitans palmerolidicus]